MKLGNDSIPTQYYNYDQFVFLIVYVATFENSTKEEDITLHSEAYQRN